MSQEPDERLPEHYEEMPEEEKQPYTPRPKWQVVMAWVLLLIVIAGIINICYWEIRG